MSSQQQVYAGCQMLNIKKVIERTGLGRSTIYAMQDPKSEYYDDSFPKKVPLTIGRVAWVDIEIDAWIASKIQQSRQTGDDQV
jgi:prophage regulatory protein